MPTASLAQLLQASLVGLAIVTTFSHRADAAPERALDQCGANQFARFVGRPLADLQAMRPAEARFVCRSCAMTTDVRPSRLTVIYADKTMRIIRLSCE